MTQWAVGVMMMSLGTVLCLTRRCVHVCASRTMTPCVCVCVYAHVTNICIQVQFRAHGWKQQWFSKRGKRRQMEGGSVRGRSVIHSCSLSTFLPPLYGQNYWSPSLHLYTTHTHTLMQKPPNYTQPGGGWSSPVSWRNHHPTPFWTLTGDKHTDILCIAASLCLFALLLSSLGMFGLFAVVLKPPLFRQIKESRRPRRDRLVLRKSSGASLGGKGQRNKVVEEVETQWGEWWWWWDGVGCWFEAEKSSGSLKETAAELARGGKDRRAGRAYLKRLCL